MKHIHASLLLSVTSLLFSSLSLAAPVSYTFYGTVSQVSGVTNPGVSLNDSVVLTLSYDTDASLDDCFDGCNYSANHPVSIAVAAGGWSYSLSSNSAGWFLLNDFCDAGQLDVYCEDMYAVNLYPSVPSSINGSSWNYARLSLSDSTIGEGVAIPVDLISSAFNGIPEIHDWQDMSLSFYNGITTVLSMTIDYAPAPVPLPAAGWLFASGIFAVLMAGGRKRNNK